VILKCTDFDHIYRVDQIDIQAKTSRWIMAVHAADRQERVNKATAFWLHLVLMHFDTPEKREGGATFLRFMPYWSGLPNTHVVASGHETLEIEDVRRDAEQNP